MTDNFKCTILTETLKQVLNSVLAITDEGRIVIDESGFRIGAADPANIGMVNVSIGKELFVQFDYHSNLNPALESKSGTIEIGADFARLYHMVQVMNDPMTELMFDNAKIYLKAGGYDYTLSQLDTSTLKPDPKVPSLEFPVNLIRPGSELQGALRAASKLQTDGIEIGIKDNEFFMFIDNGIGDKLRLTLDADKIQGLGQGTEDCSSKYNLQYLARMVKGIGHVPEVTLRLRSDYPLAAEFGLGPEDSFVKYMIAPRIAEDKK